MRITPPILLAFGLTALVACGSDNATIGSDDMWARPTASDAINGEFYGTITNNGDVTIAFEDGYSRACDRVEIHQSTIEDGVVSTGLADEDVTTLDPGESLVMEPLGLHVICIGLEEPLVEGTPVDLEMTFDGAGAFVAEVVIEQR